jgi:hypothetical protein
MNIVADSMLARLKRLPLRLRIADLAALIRGGRRVRHALAHSSICWLP